MKQTRRFDHEPESVPLARRFATEALRGTAADALDTVALMVSELASNCIRHTDSGFDLTITRSAGEIRVEATDQGSGVPRMRSSGPSDPSGRGLQIVDLLSAEWGYAPLPGPGKTVWFSVALGLPSGIA